MTHASLRILALAAVPILLVACAGEVEVPEPDQSGEWIGDQTRTLQGDDCDAGARRSCTRADGSDGVEECGWNDDLETEWSECFIPPTPEDCSEYSHWDGTCCMDEYGCCEDDYDCNTPLVLAFDGEPIAYGTETDVSFDLTAHGECRASDWPAATTPWLALDRNGNGRIDDGTELFGSATRLTSGLTAPQGFAALAELDADHDGRITAADPAWSRLVLWSDADRNRTSEGELASLETRGIVAIDLGWSLAIRCDERGNCEGERAAFVWRDASGAERTGAVVDVHLRLR
jgi:hypothetical protein